MVFPPPKSSKKIKRRYFALWVIAAFGVLAILLGLYFDYQRKILSFYVTPVASAEAQPHLSTPTHIKITGAKIDIDVTTGRIVNGIWEISPDFASYLNTSAKPGGGGNIVIYGHNKRRIFGNLTGLSKVGQTIELTTDDGVVHEYKVDRVLTVEPDDIDTVLPTPFEVLTVYTCKGFLDSERLVLKALPVEPISD